jgi:hypothetical protein
LRTKMLRHSEDACEHTAAFHSNVIATTRTAPQPVHFSLKKKSIVLFIFNGALSSVVGWGTVLQAGRSSIRVPDEVDFSIYLILPAALWPWSRLSL